jgi:2,3,4,5-tetrahydropyridine-2-carboxylate N-succinyltransferase
MTLAELESFIDGLGGEAPPQALLVRAREAVDALLTLLEEGSVRAAERAADGSWRAVPWVKRGILLGFRIGKDVEQPAAPPFYFRDRDTFPTLDGSRLSTVRIVPGGTTVRRGSFLGERVVVMPPAYINVGAYVGAGTMVDSHALVGSCAQIGRNVHLSAAAQIGGVLEPIGAAPVVIDDGAFVGGGCGVYEGVHVGRDAVLAPGVILSSGTPIHDLVKETVHETGAGSPVTVPAGAVVVPGSRPSRSEFGKSHGLHLQTPVIVKYRDSGTSAALELEQALR